MKDLTSRLRSIVRREPIGGPARELTYVPVPDVTGRDDAAERLGGRTLQDEPGGEGCLAIDRVWAADRSYGRKRVESFQLASDAPIGLFDPRAARVEDWARRVVFFDIETTGLSGGAGTVAFLVGCAWFDAEGFRVRQFFLTSPSGERALLAALGRVFDEASMLVTYNGRTFDIPLMSSRWAFHRQSDPTGDLPHFDMLPPARRLWKQREDGEGCSLSTLERAVLGFHRLDDVPGFEIPARYFQFLRSGDAAVIEGVLDHNRHDLVSLAALTAHALWLAQEGPQACREPAEQLALGRLYERHDTARAEHAYEMAARAADLDVRRQALAHLAVLRRRDDRHAEAADAWEMLLGLSDGGRPRLPLERRAAEALAIHHEHRARDPREARRYANLLAGTGHDAGARVDEDVRHRLRRLERKIAATDPSGSVTRPLDFSS